MLQTKASPGMSGSEVSGCVELVTAAFNGGAGLIGRLSRKHKWGKGQRNYHEVLLFQVLEGGGKRIQETYNEGFKRYGSPFKLGDDGARERLLCVAIETHAEVVQVLQTALDQDRAQLDLTRLHETAVTNRHDALRALTDLRQRLELLQPLRNISRFSPDSSVCGDELARRSNVHLLSTSSPFAVPSPPQKSGLRRMLSVGGGSAHRRTQSEEPQAERPDSICESIVPPAPLSFATPVTRVGSNDTSPTRSSHQRSHSDTKRHSAKRIESIAHPDVHDFAAARDARLTARARSNSTSAHQSKRNSIISLLPGHSREPALKVSTTEQRGMSISAVPPPPPFSNSPESIHPAERSWSLPGAYAMPDRSSRPLGTCFPVPAQTTGVIPVTLDTRLPVPHSGRPEIASPIYEVDDASSVNSRDYDAESVYSREEDNDSDTPPTPITEPSSNNSDPSTPSSERKSGSLKGSSSLRSSNESTSDRSPASPQTRDSLGEQFITPKRPITSHTPSLSASSVPITLPLPSPPAGLFMSPFMFQTATKPAKHKRAMTADSPATAMPDILPRGVSYEATVTAARPTTSPKEDHAERKKGFWHLRRESKDKKASESEKQDSKPKEMTDKEKEKEKIKKAKERAIRDHARMAQWTAMSYHIG